MNINNQNVVLFLIDSKMNTDVANGSFHQCWFALFSDFADKRLISKENLQKEHHVRRTVSGMRN